MKLFVFLICGFLTSVTFAYRPTMMSINPGSTLTFKNDLTIHLVGAQNVYEYKDTGYHTEVQLECEISGYDSNGLMLNKEVTIQKGSVLTFLNTIQEKYNYNPGPYPMYYMRQIATLKSASNNILKINCMTWGGVTYGTSGVFVSEFIEQNDGADYGELVTIKGFEYLMKDFAVLTLKPADPF